MEAEFELEEIVACSEVRNKFAMRIAEIGFKAVADPTDLAKDEKIKRPELKSVFDLGNKVTVVLWTTELNIEVQVLQMTKLGYRITGVYKFPALLKQKRLTFFGRADEPYRPMPPRIALSKDKKLIVFWRETELIGLSTLDYSCKTLVDLLDSRFCQAEKLMDYLVDLRQNSDYLHVSSKYIVAYTRGALIHLEYETYKHEVVQLDFPTLTVKFTPDYIVNSVSYRGGILLRTLLGHDDKGSCIVVILKLNIKEQKLTSHKLYKFEKTVTYREKLTDLRCEKIADNHLVMFNNYKKDLKILMIDPVTLSLLDSYVIEDREKALEREFGGVFTSNKVEYIMVNIVSISNDPLGRIYGFLLLVVREKQLKELVVPTLINFSITKRVTMRAIADKYLLFSYYRVTNKLVCRKIRIKLGV